ncbi:MAG: hypothetical protein ACPGN3_05850 [Opitutales bacterium]
MTEHEGRMMCRSCIDALTIEAASAPSGTWMPRVLSLAYAVGGALILFLFFYLFGEFVSKIPSNFHDGTFLE